MYKYKQIDKCTFYKFATGFKKNIDLSKGFMFKYNHAIGFKTDKSTT